MKNQKQKFIGWVFFLMTIFSLFMTYVMAYFPPPVSETGNAVYVGPLLVIPLFIVTAIYLFTAYDK